jgi:3-deoxy-D-manno-octulosonic-acid transferase
VRSVINRRIYTALLYGLLPFLPLRLAWRARKQPEYLQHVGERFGFYSEKSNKPIIWLHAVSVGETRAAAPLIKLFQQRHPDHQILLTHMTPTGRATSAELWGDGILRCYLPYDFPFVVKKFLRHFQPKLGVLLETELWPNLISICHEQNIPLALINARLSQRSARGYARFPALTRDALEKLTLIAAQASADQERLQSLFSGQVSVMGNLKFDNEVPTEQIQLGKNLRTHFGENRAVWLAASTRDSEEKILLDAIKKIQMRDALAVIVPRHPQRFNEVADLLKSNQISFQRRSENAAIASSTRVVLGDSMGEMFAYYAACDVAFIAGSLLPLGGQNLIEACAVGKPVLIGPHTFNFAEATDQAISTGAAKRVADAQELAQEIDRLFADPTQRKAMSDAGLAFTAAHRGASVRAYELVSSLLTRPAI